MTAVSNTQCQCGHGRHTHVHYTGACGLCGCPYVRADEHATVAPGENREEQNR